MGELKPHLFRGGGMLPGRDGDGKYPPAINFLTGFYVNIGYNLENNQMMRG
jgi:hypothetical protein